MYEGPEFRHLISFLAIAEECSFSRAAQRLHISQPALSAQIKQIEEGLGTSLFKRTRAGAELTRHGRAFLPSARKMVQLRSQAVRDASPEHTARSWPIRLGYSPFVDRGLVEEALTGYCELVPEGEIHAISECTAPILRMIEHERLDAGIVNLPADFKGFSINRICRDRLLICLRRDDPFANADTLPKKVIEERLRIMVAPAHHPRLHEKLLRQFRKAGMELHPTEFVCGPADMQFLVKARKCFGLVREKHPLDPDLTTQAIPDLDLKIQTALVFKEEQERPVLPLLAYRMQQRCAEKVERSLKRPPVRAAEFDRFNHRAAS